MYRFLTAAILVASATFAQTSRPTTRPAGADTLTTSAVVDAPADEIFDCFKTGDGFVRAMGVAKAKVDFHVGGQIRSAYQADADLDSDRVIVNTILAYEPNRMISFKPTPPAGAPDWLQAICDAGFTVIRLDPISPQRTKVTSSMVGFGEGELFDRAYSFFKQGNEATFKHMQQSLGHGDVDDRARRAFDLFKSCAGSEWTAREVRKDGSVLRGRGVWSANFDGQLIECRGELGDDSKLTPHTLMLIAIDAATHNAYTELWTETNWHGRASLTLLPDHKTVATDWTFSMSQGQANWMITYEFVDKDNFTMRMWRTPEAIGEPMVVMHYKRTAATAGR